MKNIVCVCMAVLLLFGCKNSTEKGRFQLNGEIKNLADQKIFLEEIYMSQKDPEVVDTADIKNGKFTLTALAPEQGLYRLRLEKDKKIFVFINDQPEISLSANSDNLAMESVSFSSPANGVLRKFIINSNQQMDTLQSKAAVLQQFTADKKNDSVYLALLKTYVDANNAYQDYLVKFIDTCSNPIVSLFALGYTKDVETEKLEKPVASLSKRFPDNAAVATVASQFKQMMEAAKQQQPQQQQNIPKPGDIAPEITMPDTEGKLFSLSSLKGKYVLVDFWASWCLPCRAENPNLRNAFNKYQNRNFTILGVSLDKTKAEWIEAIKADGLNWKHISDLKHWQSAAVPLYGLEGIPYNVLLDPEGKIIATSLRGEDLDRKLAEVLR